MTQAQRDRDAQKERDARWLAIDAGNLATTRLLCTETSADVARRLGLVAEAR